MSDPTQPGETLSQSATAGPRWMNWVIAFYAAVHLLSLVVVVGWYYYVVPWWKKAYEESGLNIDGTIRAVIHVSDLTANYWYLIAAMALVLPVVDYFVMRWLARQKGLRWTTLFAVGLGVAMLAQLAIGRAVLALGPNPWGAG